MPSWYDFGRLIPIIPSGGGGGSEPDYSRQPGESTRDLARRIAEDIARQQTPGAPATPVVPPVYDEPVAEPPPTIAPEPFSPSTPDVPIPPPPDFGQPTPPSVQRALGEDTGSWLYAGLGSLFGVARRKPRTTAQIERELLRRYMGPLGKIVGDIFRYSGPAAARSASKAVGPVIEYGARGIGVAGGIGVIVGSMIPRTMGDGSLSPAQRELERDRAYDALKFPQDPREPGYINRRIGIPNAEFPLGREGNVSVGSRYTPFPAFPEPGPYIPQDRSSMSDELKALVRGKVVDAVRDRTGITLPTPTDIGPPRPTTSSPSSSSSRSSSSTPTPATTTSSSSRSRSGPGALPTGLPLYLAIGLIGVVVPGLFRRGGSQTRSSGITNNLPAPTTPGSQPVTPTTPELTPTLTPLIGGSVGFPSIYGSSSSSSGYCEPKPRGPRRKCLERAPVKYSGGRRKGKAAGTKCLRWEARKR